MALDLSLSVTQSNDATYLTVTDATGAYSATTTVGGWGTPNEDYADIVDSETVAGGKYHLLLQITVTDKDGTETEYDQINLYDLSSTDGDTVPFVATTDLVWAIDAADLVESATAMGLSTDTLTDGVYELTYTLVDDDDHTSVVDTHEVSILVDGASRIEVYDALRDITRQYDDEINDESKEIMEVLLKVAYLDSLNAATFESEKDDLIEMLWTLDKLNSDGSKYTW